MRQPHPTRLAQQTAANPTPKCMYIVHVHTLTIGTWRLCVARPSACPSTGRCRCFSTAAARSTVTWRNSRCSPDGRSRLKFSWDVLFASILMQSVLWCDAHFVLSKQNLVNQVFVFLLPSSLPSSLSSCGCFYQLFTYTTSIFYNSYTYAWSKCYSKWFSEDLRAAKTRC